MRCFDEVATPRIADEPESEAALICGEHVADELVVEIVAILRVQAGRLEYGPKVAVALDGVGALTGEVILGQLGLDQHAFDLQVDLSGIGAGATERDSGLESEDGLGLGRL